MKALLGPARYAGCLANSRFCPKHPEAHVRGHPFRCPDGDGREGLLFAHRLAPRFELCFLSAGEAGLCHRGSDPVQCHKFMSVAWLVGVRASTLSVGRGTGPMQRHLGVMSPWGDSNRGGPHRGLQRTDPSSASGL